MKPIIVDMKDLSDSTEVYDSKPNRFMVYTLYVILFILVAAVLWMSMFKIDIVVKSNGIFKGNSAIYEISSKVTGSIKEKHVTDGQYVEEGDVLFVLSIDSLPDTIARYQEELGDIKDRLEILSAYEASLEGDKESLAAYTENPYYDEFVNRRELLFANLELNKEDNQGQVSLYQGNIDTIEEAIGKYNKKIEKLNTVKQCITSRNNSFDAQEGYYYSIVNSYLASYNYTSQQYDNQMIEYQRQIDNYNEQIQKAEGESVSGNAFVDVKSLKRQIDAAYSAVEFVKKEKEQALFNLEMQQIAAIEQQIENSNDTILSMESNLVSATLQLETVNDVDNDAKENVAILTEKGNIAVEVLNYQEKLEECETYLNNYDIQNDNCVIRANASGYFAELQDWKSGTYVQEGCAVGTIYPGRESKYYAEIYVNNADIAKIKVGQEVKFEIAAYPSSEYGYFLGEVESVSKDIKVDQASGSAYYLVKVSCNNTTVTNKDGETGTIMNGMACQAKIVVDEENVLQYLLEKIDLLD